MKVHSIRKGLAGLVVSALFVFGFGPAQAAPQALALVATDGKVTLICAGDECGAGLTTFCLQPDRFSPEPGTPHRLARSEAIQLIGTTRDGRAVELDPEQLLHFQSSRRHVAARVSMARDKMVELGLSKVEIAVGANAVLLPVPVPGDAQPFSESEIAVVTGPLRALGARIVDGNAERMEAARIANRMINLLPPGRDAGEFGAEALWKKATGDVGAGALSSGAEKLARGAVEFCDFAIGVAGQSSLRRCLETQHDAFIDFLNSKYWEAVKTGS